MPHSSFTCHASVAPCLYIILCFLSAQAFGCKHKPLPWWSNLFLAWKCLFQAAPVYPIIVCTITEVRNQPNDKILQNTEPKLLSMHFFNFNFNFFFCHTMHAAHGISVPWSGIEPATPHHSTIRKASASLLSCSQGSLTPWTYYAGIRCWPLRHLRKSLATEAWSLVHIR